MMFYLKGGMYLMKNLSSIEEIKLGKSDEIAGCNCLGCAVGVACAACAACAGCIACIFPPAAGIALGASGSAVFAAALGSATAVAVAGGNA